MKNGHIKIEPGIPIPKPRRKPKGPLAVAMLSMQIGDSFFTDVERQNVLQHAMRYMGKGKYSMRAENDGWRVWKIA